jgi:hypothetical protein
MSEENQAPTTGRWLRWLPTSDGAVRHDRVSAVSIDRIDGEFEGGSGHVWLINVTVDGREDPVTLRPQFTDAAELVEFVDSVFPGAFFRELPPNVIAETLAGTGQRREAQGQVSGAIRQILGQLSGGNSYEPNQGYRPPPGAAPQII